MKCVCLAMTGLLATVNCVSQSLQRPIGLAYPGLSAYSKSTDVFSVTANQAALASAKQAAAGFYGERRFLLAGLSSYLASVVIPSGNGGFGCNLAYQGSLHYNNSSIGLAYGRDVGDKVSVGLQFNYRQVRIAGYGSASTLTAELGWILRLSSKLRTGMQLINPAGGTFGKTKERLPRTISFGIGYDESEDISLAMEMSKEEDAAFNITTGIRYRIVKSLVLRAGFSSATTSPWICAGLSKGSMQWNISCSYHSQLGPTPGLSIIFQFKKKEA